MRPKIPISNKIFESYETFLKLASDNGKVVFTNGCFDILHAGHVDYLEKSALKGDFLIVGLNSDKSVSRLKGENRPIINWTHRAKVLAALAFVDAVIKFDEDTPLELIENIIPDVLIKGSDYAINEIVGATSVLENGGKVETIDFVHDISTSKIIEKLRN